MPTILKMDSIKPDISIVDMVAVDDDLNYLGLAPVQQQQTADSSRQLCKYENRSKWSSNLVFPYIDALMH